MEVLAKTGGGGVKGVQKDVVTNDSDEIGVEGAEES